MNRADDFACTADDMAVTVFGADLTKSGVTHRPVSTVRTTNPPAYTPYDTGELFSIEANQINTIVSSCRKQTMLGKIGKCMAVKFRNIPLSQQHQCLLEAFHCFCLWLAEEHFYIQQA